MTDTSWAPSPLAEFLSVITSLPGERSILHHALELVTEAVGAGFGAVLRNGTMVSSVGLPSPREDRDTLLEAVEFGADRVQLDGKGVFWLLVVPVGDAPSQMVLGATRPFTPEQSGFALGAGPVLALATRMRRLVGVEQELRAQSHRQSDDNSKMAAALRKRQALLDGLSDIQRAIAERVTLHDVLDLVTATASQLLGHNPASLALLTPESPEQWTLASSRPMPVSGHSAHRSPALMAAASAAGRRAVEENSTVLVAEPQVIAAPVRERGVAVGWLAVAAAQPGCSFGPDEQQLLATLADHASLAVHDARTVAAMHQAVDEAMHQALHDSLTGLPNRALFLDRLTHALGRVRRDRAAIAVLFVDLDNFKVINDSRGHAAGDLLLMAVAERLVGGLRTSDTAARLGGDEFAILLEDMQRPGDATKAAQRMLEALQNPIPVSGEELFANASIGIAISSGQEDADELLRNADVAMYRAKTQGRGRYAVFKPEMHAAVLSRAALEADLRRAVEQEELSLVYQPIVSLESNRLAGVEALVRWEHPSRGSVPPSQFIPLAEDTGLIVPLGRWVMERACRQVRTWQLEHPSDPPLYVSVNLSARQMQRPWLIRDVAQVLAGADLAPQSLVLEITETILMKDTEASMATLWGLKQLGVRLAIDDFGTGYSSLGYLRRFPIDILKIDKSFVDDLVGENEDSSLAHAIVQLGVILHLQTVAEGVEHIDQLDQLRALGCGSAQGYYFARPLSRSQVSHLLGQRSHHRPQADDASGPATPPG